MAEEAVESGAVSQGVRALFFMLTPNETSFEKVEDVPHYVQQVGDSPVCVSVCVCVCVCLCVLMCMC